jgi:hypothetical protein
MSVAYLTDEMILRISGHKERGATGLEEIFFRGNSRQELGLTFSRMEFLIERNKFHFGKECAYIGEGGTAIRLSYTQK